MALPKCPLLNSHPVCILTEGKGSIKKNSKIWDICQKGGDGWGQDFIQTKILLEIVTKWGG